MLSIVFEVLPGVPWIPAEYHKYNCITVLFRCFVALEVPSIPAEPWNYQDIIVLPNVFEGLKPPSTPAEHFK